MPASLDDYGNVYKVLGANIASWWSKIYEQQNVINRFVSAVEDEDLDIEHDEIPLGVVRVPGKASETTDGRRITPSWTVDLQIYAREQVLATSLTNIYALAANLEAHLRNEASVILPFDNVQAEIDGWNSSPTIELDDTVFATDISANGEEDPGAQQALLSLSFTQEICLTSVPYHVEADGVVNAASNDIASTLLATNYDGLRAPPELADGSFRIKFESAGTGDVSGLVAASAGHGLKIAGDVSAAGSRTITWSGLASVLPASDITFGIYRESIDGR